MQELDHKKYLQLCYDIALKASENGEVPVGALIVNEQGQILSQSGNQVVKELTSNLHAEMIVIQQAQSLYHRQFNNWRLTDCTLYVNLEPCMMCMGAIINSRLKSLVYACPEEKMGFAKSLSFEKPQHLKLPQILGPLDPEPTKTLMKSFFEAQRHKKKLRPKLKRGQTRF